MDSSSCIYNYIYLFIYTYTYYTYLCICITIIVKAKEAINLKMGDMREVQERVSGRDWREEGEEGK